MRILKVPKPILEFLPDNSDIVFSQPAHIRIGSYKKYKSELFNDSDSNLGVIQYLTLTTLCSAYP